MTGTVRRRPVVLQPPNLSEKARVKTPEVQRERKGAREKAMMLYIAAVKPLSCREVADRIGSTNVPQSTIERWKLTDGWDAARDEFQRNLFAQVQSRVADKLVQNLLQMLSDVDPIKARLIERVRDETFDTTSADKAVTALVKLLEMQAKFTEQAVGLLTPKAQSPQDPMVPITTVQPAASQSPEENPNDALSYEDARAAAIAIMRRRREAAEAESARLVGPSGTDDPS